MTQVDRTPAEALAATREFEAWYEATFERVARALAAITDAEIAADATAEAFVRAFERWHRVGAMQNPDGWVYQVARNVARRRWRRRTVEMHLLSRIGRGTESDEDRPDPELWEAVQQLAPRQREAIALRYLGGYSEAEVADAMGVSEGTASATLATARKRLVTLLGEGER